MRALLDTNTFVWWILGKLEKLSSRTQDVISDGRNEILFSVASAWEIAIKAQLRKLRFLEGRLSDVIPEQIYKNGFQVLSIQLDHALGVYELPAHHRDPFDRLIIAQSQIEQLPILTNDTEIKRYEVEIIW